MVQPIYDIVKAHGGEMKVVTKEGEVVSLLFKLLARLSPYKLRITGLESRYKMLRKTKYLRTVSFLLISNQRDACF